jgi:hypothetical protein
VVVVTHRRVSCYSLLGAPRRYERVENASRERSTLQVCRTTFGKAWVLDGCCSCLMLCRQACSCRYARAKVSLIC